MNQHLENLRAELSQHAVGSINWLQIVAEIVAFLNQLLNPPAPTPPTPPAGS